VSPTGSDSGDGTADHPYLTLAKAQTAARASSIKTILLASGTYYLTSTLNFTAADSGETWGAESGASPVISGGVPITGWTSMGNGTYVATSPKPIGLDLQINGSKQLPAASGFDSTQPFTTGWRVIDASTTQTVKRVINVYPADLTPSVKVGALIQIMPDSRYTDQFGVITNITGNQITYSGGGSNPVSAGSWRVLADSNDLDGNGQFAYNSTTKQVSIKPVATCSINATSNVVAAQLDTLFSVVGASNLTITGLTFSDTNVPRAGYTDYSSAAYNAFPIAAVMANGMTQSSISNNKFYNVGNGISMIGSSNNQIRANVFAQLGGSGIIVKTHSDYVTVANNVMQGLGKINAGSFGIYVLESANGTIDANYIDGVGRWGISLSPTSVGSMTNMTVSNNTILNSNLQTNDTSAIYAYAGSMTGYVDIQSVISGNRIENTGGLGRDNSGNYAMGQNVGIYMDDHVSGVTYSKNVILTNYVGMFLCHGCQSNKADNNVVLLQSAPVYDKGLLGQSSATAAMPNNGTLYMDVLPSYFPRKTGPYKIVLQMMGTSTDAVQPHFNVLVDGTNIGSGNATVGAVTQYVFDATVAPQLLHRVAIQLDNGSTSGASTRALSSMALFVNNTAVPLSTVSAYGAITLNDDLTVTNFSVTRNITYRAVGAGASVNTNTNAAVDTNPGVLDYNLMWKSLTKSSSVFFGSPASTHEDVHSLIADPLFTNVDTGDLRMSASSPASSLGIVTTGVPLAPVVPPTNLWPTNSCTVY
jgi:parallel beta-helix repeat protein